MLMHAPIMHGPIMLVPDMTLPATVFAAGPGVALNYTLEMFPSSGTRIAAAKFPFITPPSDTLSNQPFDGTLVQGLKVSRSIVGGDGFGQISVTVGELTLINAGRDYDATVLNDTIDGRRVLIKCGWMYAGNIPASYDTYATLLDGLAEDWHADNALLRVTIRANDFKLDVPASPNKYGGTGGVDGTADMAGKRKPRAFGDLVTHSGSGGNVTPPLIDPPNQVYQVHDGSVSSIAVVYDTGYALTFTTDVADYAALISGAFAAGSFRTCKALGLFRLASQPNGAVTCDVLGDSSPTYVSDTASIVRRLIFTSTTIDLVDEGAFSAVTAAQGAAVGYYLGLDDNKTVKQACEELMQGIGGWGPAFRRDGLLDIGLIVAPAGTPVASYTNADMKVDTLQRLELPHGINPPPKNRRVAYARNWTVQPQVLASVAAARAQMLKDPWSVAASTNTSLSATILAAHKLAKDPDPVLSYLALAPAAVAEANRLLVLYGGTVRSLYSFVLKEGRGFNHNIGHVIFVTYPRFDLVAGKLLVIVAIDDDTTAGEVLVTAFG